ncbi:MAG: lipopolysaccharide core biosynthesis protein [Candidatus Scalindua rubra]|uniref:Lipopolysaccharide core biosynthesis protein n=1 Tax=Candidatus Scalindua rubra TaxID=1872076 RepID=A0A1E3XC31_9BACT|nr:MAG: lipopolysaccharide core biosynthesis protein [Candidatus Scalindua rubra]
MNIKPIKNVGFISTRIAGTDGVSLEIEKWAEVLKRNRFDCFYFAGEIDRDEEISFKVEEAHFEHPEVYDISKSLFGTTKRTRKISKNIQKIQEQLKTALYDFRKKFKIDLIIPENALTIPLNIPLGIAITEFIAETGIPTIAHHHDFCWERDRFLINACQDYLDKAFPPDLPSIRHAVINSPASKQLSHRLGISNTIIPNVYDFAKEPEGLENFPCELKSRIGIKEDELFILQPTRVVPRKWIERSIEIVQNLKLPDPTLVISHTSGDEGDDYYHRVMEYSKFMGVKIITIDHLIGNRNAKKNKKYTIADVYKCADIITYPSGYEGFGNAFLETVYYNKPIVVNRYSIYIADIEPKGFDVITINGVVNVETVAKIKRVLEDKEYREKMVKKNYDLAKQFFSFEILEKKLMYMISTFD